jgi:hypothetical protein
VVAGACYLLISFKRNTVMEGQAFFLNPFTICSSCKQRFLVCPFADEETNGSYPFANGQNGLNGLAHLWLYMCLGRMGRQAMKFKEIVSRD